MRSRVQADYTRCPTLIALVRGAIHSGSSMHRRQDLHMFRRCFSSAFGVDSFMLRRHEALHGRSLAEVILDEAIDIQQMLDLPSMELNGEQGGM